MYPTDRHKGVNAVELEQSADMVIEVADCASTQHPKDPTRDAIRNKSVICGNVFLGVQHWSSARSLSWFSSSLSVCQGQLHLTMGQGARKANQKYFCTNPGENASLSVFLCVCALY